MDYLPAELFSWRCVPYSTTQHIRSLELASVHCRKVTQDAIHHVVQIDKSVQITTASCKKGSFIVSLISTNLSLLNRHTSTDFGDIFRDHVT